MSEWVCILVIVSVFDIYLTSKMGK